MATDTTTATTFERYKGTQARNYCTLPTIDVPILDPASECRTCDKPIRYDTQAHSFGTWVHVDTAIDHRADVKSKCTYCGCTDPALVVYQQHAWYDATECARCGGVNGVGLGD